MKDKPTLDYSGTERLVSPAGEVSTLGQFVADVRYRDRQYTMRFITNGQSNNLLARSAVEQLSGSFGDFRLMKTKPVKIVLMEDAVPFHVCVPRRIPFHLLKKVENDIKRMEEMKVISKIDEPTDWCAAMVPVTKSNGGIRLCVDLRHLNKPGEVFILPTVEDISQRLTGPTVFSTLDCSNSFWQLPLDQASARLITFITPVGRSFRSWVVLF